MGSESERAHARWYRLTARYYDAVQWSNRVERAVTFLDDLFRRHPPVHEVLDVACGTFSIDLPLMRRGYRIVGRDLSRAMLSVARRNLRAAGRTADLAQGDMRSLNFGRTFDAILCLGTAFNYLATADDARQALRSFRRHLRPGGLLVLDLTNFAAWIARPRNARAEIDQRAPDGTRLAIFAFNEQSPSKKTHFARFITVVQRGDRIDIAWDEAPLRVWHRAELERLLRGEGFRPLGWCGDLAPGARYDPRKSPRLAAVAAKV